MRILILCMIFPSLISSHSSQIIKKISQNFSIENYSTSLIMQLDGDIEVVFWEGDDLVVETIIFDQTSGATEYALNYAISKGSFELEVSLTENVNVLLLQPKKINRTIFRKGHQQKTKQVYKIFLPKRLQYSIQ